MNTASTIPLVTVAHFAQLLQGLQQGTPGVVSATLASVDGLTVTSTLSDAGEADRLSAMAGSLGGLAAALAHESGRGEPRRLILDTAQGLVVAVHVPRPAGALVLTVVAEARTVLGHLLWHCRQVGERMAAA